MTPSAESGGGVGNTWILESFVDIDVEETLSVESILARQRSQIEGYEIKELLTATVGGNTQQGAVTTVYIWFIATFFLDIGGSVELHAPPDYELRCFPRVLYISLPSGACHLNKGVTSTTGDVYHQYLSLELTLPGQQVYPNTAYEFGVSAVNPTTPSTPNYWGIVLRKSVLEVADASRTLAGYELTDYHLVVQNPLASSTYPAVVNSVKVALTFEKQLAAGEIGHITIMAPSSTKVLCQRFKDTSGGGSSRAMLPLSTTIGKYGTHTCQLQYSITLHVEPAMPVLASTYLLELGVLNPSIRAAKDFWTILLLPVVEDPTLATLTAAANGTANSSDYASSWRTAKALLSLQVAGFGVSYPFTGPDIYPFEVSGCKALSIGVAALLLMTA